MKAEKRRFRLTTIILLVVAIVLLLPNLPYGRRVVNTWLNHFVYVTTYGQQFEEWQFFGSKYDHQVARLFAEYRQHPYTAKDSVLYRLDAVNPLKFWRWYDYTTHPRWKLPYNSRPDTLPINDRSAGSEPRTLPPLRSQSRSGTLRPPE